MRHESMRRPVSRAVLRGLVATALVLVTTLAVSTQANAQAADSCAVDITDYEGSASVTVSDLSPEAGDTITFVGSGFPPGSAVPLALNGEAIGSPVTDSTGSFSFSYTIPSDLAAGTTLTFTATCGAFVLTQTLTVASSAVPTTVPQGRLPVTGSDNGWLVRAGLALVAAGGTVLLVARRRQAATLPTA